MNIILVSVDGLGIGEMDDTNEKSNTWQDLLNSSTIIDFPFMKLISKSWFSLRLDYQGADSYLGHLAMSGIKVDNISLEPLITYKQAIGDLLSNNGYKFITYKGMIVVNEKFIIYDNFEADHGLAINIAGVGDKFSFDEQLIISRKIRKIIKNPRLITFSAKGVTMNNYKENAVSDHPFYGLKTPKTGVYNKTFQVHHLSVITNFKDSFQFKFAANKWKVYEYGKFANIIKIENDDNVILNNDIEIKSIFKSLSKNKSKNSLHCINIQQTDLAGHQGDIKSYINALNELDKYLQILNKEKNNLLIITSDHGNSPLSKNGMHSREYVPFWSNGPKANIKKISQISKYLLSFLK